MTDAEGQFVAPLVTSTLYTISTGLAAISFSPILETGSALAARSPVTIEAQRLIASAEDPCRILIDGAPYVYFSSNNTTDQTLTVPLSYTALNQIYSVTGQAVPPESFAPGTTGFSLSESYFTSGTTLMGVWKFLGQDVTVKPDLRICADRSVPGQCEVIDPVLLRRPLEHTRTTILKLVRLSLAAARAGLWKGSNGRFAVPFMTRGARSLAYIDQVLPDTRGASFACGVVPMSCSARQVPKKELERSFAKIFVGRVPRGLEHISRRSKKEKADFQRMLKTLPDTYVKCE
ncbi:MAG: hypothetical protein RL518_40 [Pseudomonadota bacterium]